MGTSKDLTWWVVALALGPVLVALAVVLTPGLVYRAGLLAGRLGSALSPLRELVSKALLHALARFGGGPEAALPEALQAEVDKLEDFSLDAAVKDGARWLLRGRWSGRRVHVAVFEAQLWLLLESQVRVVPAGCRLHWGELEEAASEDGEAFPITVPIQFNYRWVQQCQDRSVSSALWAPPAPLREWLAQNPSNAVPFRSLGIRSDGIEARLPFVAVAPLADALRKLRGLLLGLERAAR